MKRYFLLLLIVLAAGAWIGEKMVQDPGYALLAYGQTTVETSLWVLLLGAFLAFLLLHWTVNLFFKARIPTGKIKAWQERRHHKQAQNKTLKGLMAFSEGRWWKAQRLLTQAADHSEQPLINYLAAAQAAHEQREDTLADELLQEARNKIPQAELAVGISQVKIQLDRGQIEPALATLLRLRQLAPKHTYLLRLLKDVYLRLQDWQGLTGLLPELKKQQVIDTDEAQTLEERCYSEMLGSALTRLPVETDDATRLEALNKEWKSIPSALSSSEPMVKHYIKLLADAGSEAEGEAFLRSKIKQHWDEELVKLYGRVEGEDPHKQLEVAKGWLKKHPDSAELNLTLARLSMRNEHWGKAVDYLEDSLKIQKTTEACNELARLLHHLGEHERSLEVMQDSFSLVNNDLPALPLPKPEKPTPAPEQA